MNHKSYFSIFQELQEWSKQLENWQRFALLKLLRESSIDEDNIKTIYEEFKVDKGLSQSLDDRKTYELESSFVPQVVKQLKHVILQEICNAKGVNAIVEGQKLKFGPKLTVIYGPNASGKSGYARILKAACFTRSEDIEILGNVHSDTGIQGQASATCVFADTSRVDFLEREICPQLRDNFAVFDSSCIRIYTDTKKDFNVSPYGFDVFPGLVKITSRIRDLLREEVKKRTPDIDTFKIEDSSSRISQILSNINADTNLEELTKFKEFGDAEEKKVKEISHQIEELLKKDPTELIKQKGNYIRDISKLASKIYDIDKDLGIKVANQVESSIIEVGERKEIVNAASAAQFGNEPVQPIGTQAWRALIKTAIAYNDEAYPGLGFPADSADVRCVLCQQLLSKEAKNRLSRFFAFVRSDAEKNLQTAKQKLNSLLIKLEGIDISFFGEESVMRRTLEECDSNLANNVGIYLDDSSQHREKLLKIIDQEKWSKIPAAGKSPMSGCQELQKKLKEEIVGLKKRDISERKNKLSNELQYLKDRKHLSAIFLKVKQAIENMQWIRKAQLTEHSLNPRHITEKQRDMIKELVGKGFIEQFRKECESLNVPLPLDVKIAGADGVTHRKLTVGSVDRSIPDPSKVLSEGEQTAVALADFLTEIGLNEQLLGIIFDDPVNSFDHIRKERIAKRLAEEANTRQVIIFTHDILFTHHLAEAAVSNKVDFKAATISIDPNKKIPGYVNHAVFPYEHYEKASAKQARNYLDEAKELIGVPQIEKLELGIGSLRAAYEDFIQRHILNDVVGRWREQIKATALSHIYFDEKLVKEIEEHYSFLSRYEKGHSHSPEFHETPLNVGLLQEEIGKFDIITGTYKKAVDKYRKQKSEEKKRMFS
jgi:energy-coupling factor transporter ATP-binding protein EcfA2